MRIPPLAGVFFKSFRPASNPGSPPVLPDEEEKTLARQLLAWGQHHDRVLVLFAVLNLLTENAKDLGFRSQAKVVSRGVMEHPSPADSPGRPRAFGLIAGQELLGSRGEAGWSQVCASEAAHHGWSKYFYSSTYALEQMAGSVLERKSYLPADAVDRINAITDDLRSRWRAHQLDQGTPPSPANPSRPRL